MSRQKAEYRMGTGATSMLMIFIVLCLTTLAILAYSAARSDLSMTKRSLMMVETYYEAANDAQRVISKIDEQLVKLRRETLEAARAEAEEAYAEFEGVEPEYIEAAALEIAARMYVQAVEAISVEGVETAITEGRYISFMIDAQYDRLVQVLLELLPPGEAERYQVIRHNLVFIDNWEPEFGFELFQTPEMHSQMDEGGSWQLEDDADGAADDEGVELILD